MIKIIVFVFLLLIAGVLILAATRPDTFKVERSLSMQASPEKIFALIGEFRQWESWSPWEKKDPAMQRQFSELTSGKGTSYAWDGNKDVGKGSMTITEATAPSRLVLDLDFEKPFAAHNMVTFTLTPDGDATSVKWTMEGPVPYFAKIVHLFLNMDAMVGKDFEAGLANMKRAAEK